MAHVRRLMDFKICVRIACDHFVGRLPALHAFWCLRNFCSAQKEGRDIVVFSITHRNPLGFLALARFFPVRPALGSAEKRFQARWDARLSIALISGDMRVL